MITVTDQLPRTGGNYLLKPCPPPKQFHWWTPTMAVSAALR